MSIKLEVKEMTEYRYFYRAIFRKRNPLPIEARDVESAWIMALTVTGKKPTKIEYIGEVR